MPMYDAYTRVTMTYMECCVEKAHKEWPHYHFGRDDPVSLSLFVAITFGALLNNITVLVLKQNSPLTDGKITNRFSCRFYFQSDTPGLSEWVIL